MLFVFEIFGIVQESRKLALCRHQLVGIPKGIRRCPGGLSVSLLGQKKLPKYPFFSVIGRYVKIISIIIAACHYGYSAPITSQIK